MIRMQTILISFYSCEIIRISLILLDLFIFVSPISMFQFLLKLCIPFIELRFQKSLLFGLLIDCLNIVASQ